MQQFDAAKVELFSIAQQPPVESFNDGDSVRFRWGFATPSEAKTLGAALAHLPEKFGAMVAVHRKPPSVQCRLRNDDRLPNLNKK